MKSLIAMLAVSASFQPLPTHFDSICNPQSESNIQTQAQCYAMFLNASVFNASMGDMDLAVSQCAGTISDVYRKSMRFSRHFCSDAAVQLLNWAAKHPD